MVAAITNFTASSPTPVVSSVVAQPVSSPKAQPSSSAPAGNTSNAISSIGQINQVQQIRANAEPIAAREQQESLTQQQRTDIKLPESQNGPVLSDTYRVVGSAPDFQVHSTGNSVYLTHSSGYIISIATGQEREKIQFNDSSSKVQQVMKLGSEALPEPTDTRPNNGYTRSGNLAQLSVPTGILQNIQA